jgi:hypothetical protein
MLKPSILWKVACSPRSPPSVYSPAGANARHPRTIVAASVAHGTGP